MTTKNIAGTMGDWRSKKSNKRTHSSQTAGILKGGSCIATVTDRYFAKKSRSYKDPKYAEWCAKCDKLNGNRG